jgi:hypothetical protein
LLITACAGSAAVRGATNMQPDTNSAPPLAVTEAMPALDCKTGRAHCTGDDDCCSHLCIEQVCAAPRE